jgi:hypothetical protein
MAYDPKNIAIKPEKYAEAKRSGLNAVEIDRIYKMIYETGIRENEEYYHQLQKHLTEVKSKIKVFVIYEWQKSRNGEHDILRINHLVKS